MKKKKHTMKRDTLPILRQVYILITCHNFTDGIKSNHVERIGCNNRSRSINRKQTDTYWELVGTHTIFQITRVLYIAVSEKTQKSRAEVCCTLRGIT